MKPVIPKIEKGINDDKKLSQYDASYWVVENHHIVNEKGEPIEFEKHQFQIDIYDDQSDNLVVIKAAQIGMSTLEILKNIRDAEMNRMDIIYTLPTDGDVTVFVSGKVNRIIANNKHLENLTTDKDSIEQKQIGQSMIYFRGTWTKRAAIMVTADRLVHDEIDSSKQDVVADYQARLQHSKFKQIHVFSHPSIPNQGVDVRWMKSDQKEWFITCPHCKKEQYLSWNTEDEKKMSIDLEKKEFICKKCHGILNWKDRANGRWVAKYDRNKHPEIEWSGYHISLLMAPWITASGIIDKYNEVMTGKQTMDYFYNKVLGLPYAGGGNSVTEEMILDRVTTEKNRYDTRMIIGVDTGLALRYVYGNEQGLLGYGEMTDYMPDDTNKLQLNETLEYFLKQFPDSIMVLDQGGDIIGSRKLRSKYPGRVFLCHYGQDRKTKELIRWGEKDEFGNVVVDRNRMIQYVIDEFKDKRLNLYNGTKNEWYNYWLHWSHIYRVKEENNLNVMQYVWMRSDRDDWIHATVYWRVGISRFGGRGSIVLGEQLLPQDSYIINPDQTVDFDPNKLIEKQTGEEPWWYRPDDEDWRNT
jgi:hypothetical protein